MHQKSDNHNKKPANKTNKSTKPTTFSSWWCRQWNGAELQEKGPPGLIYLYIYIFTDIMNLLFDFDKYHFKYMLAWMQVPYWSTRWILQTLLLNPVTVESPQQAISNMQMFSEHAAITGIQSWSLFRSVKTIQRATENHCFCIVVLVLVSRCLSSFALLHTEDEDQSGEKRAEWGSEVGFAVFENPHCRTSCSWPAYRFAQSQSAFPAQ